MRRENLQQEYGAEQQSECARSGEQIVAAKYAEFILLRSLCACNSIPINLESLPALRVSRRRLLCAWFRGVRRSSRLLLLERPVVIGALG